MILNFENKNYESMWQRILYSLFKMGYVSSKYLFIYKVVFTITTILETLLLISLLSTNYEDFVNPNIRTYANFLTKEFNSSQFTYSNFDEEMSFFINFFNMIFHLDLTLYYVALGFCLSVFLLKIVEFAYFLRARISVINPTGFKSVFFYTCSIVDQIMRAFGEVGFMCIALVAFSCKDNRSVLFDLECFSSQHIILVILAGVILLYIILNLLFFVYFYDPCNLQEDGNFGLSENFNQDLLWFCAKVVLVAFNVFNPWTVVELVKVSCYIGINLLYFLILYKKITKFNNFFQNAIIIKQISLLMYAVFILIYILTSTKISILVFIIVIVSCTIVGYLVKELILYLKTENLYARVTTLI